MIRIKKPVRRKTNGSYRVLYAANDRPIVVSILPGDVLEFRARPETEFIKK